MQKHTAAILMTLILNPVAACVGQMPKASFDPLVLTQNGQLSHERLLRSQVFALGPVGFGSAMSEDEQALRVLLTEDQAVPALKNLLSNARIEGKMYALYGLYVRDRGIFKQELDRYKIERAADVSVNTQSGCIVMPEPEKLILSRIEAGEYDPFKTTSAEK